MAMQTPPPGPPVPPCPRTPPPGDPYGLPTPPPNDPYGVPAPGAGYPGQPPVVPGQRTNVLAIVSLVLGIASYFTGFFLAIGAVITGHIALGQIKKTGDKGRGLAIGGLILGYLSILLGVIAVIVLIVVFAAIGVASNNLNNSFVYPTPEMTASSSPATTSSSSPDSGLGGQTTAEACTILQNQISDSITALNDNASQLQTDPAGAVTALQNLSNDFATAESQIDNPDVLEAAAQTSDDLDTMISDIQAYIADPSTGGATVATDGQNVSTSLTALSSLCG